MQKDPKPGKLEAPETFANAYAYVANNPVNISDPTGESFWDDLFDFVVGIVVGIAAVFTGGAAAGALVGLLGIQSTILGGVVGAVAGAVVGAATGFIIGGFATGAYYAATGRDFSEGFFHGAVRGTIAGGVAGLIAGLMRGMEMAKEIAEANKPGSVESQNLMAMEPTTLCAFGIAAAVGMGLYIYVSKVRDKGIMQQSGGKAKDQEELWKTMEQIMDPESKGPASPKGGGSSCTQGGMAYAA